MPPERGWGPQFIWNPMGVSVRWWCKCGRSWGLILWFKPRLELQFHRTHR